MISVLLDRGLAPLAAEILRHDGFDAIHVSEIGMGRADDVEVLNRARQDGRGSWITTSTDTLRLLATVIHQSCYCASKDSTLAPKAI
jgi:predicted nuclease of predicted toxin-antitoxin system